MRTTIVGLVALVIGVVSCSERLHDVASPAARILPSDLSQSKGEPAGPGGHRDFGPPKGMAACTSAPILTALPAALNDTRAVVPLGNLNPGGHTFPSDHIYFLFPLDGDFGPPIPVRVYSPGNIRIIGMRSSTKVQGGTTSTDYSLYFFGCADVMFYFHHIATLEPPLSGIAHRPGSDCQTYSTGGATYTSCWIPTNVSLSAGHPIGMGGGPGVYGFDLGAYDRRTPPLPFVNADYPFIGDVDEGWNTFHTVCPIDYFASPVKQQLEAKFGNGWQVRTIAPLCGTIMQDVANTAQGRWLFDDSQHEDPHLSLVHDNIDPTKGAISVGVSVPSIPVGVYEFTPSASVASRVNVDFSSVTADGQTYCYDGFFYYPYGGAGHVLLQLVTSMTLKIEGFAGASCGDPGTWAFSAGAVTFSR